MSEKIGESLTGIITGVEAFGLFVQGIEIPAEGLIPIETLPKDNYSYERYSRSLSGSRKKNQFRLGDQVTVKVAVVDLDKRLLEFRMLASAVAPEGKKSSGKSGDRKGGSKGKGPKPAKPRKPAGKSKSKRKSEEEEHSWEFVRASGKTRKHREAAKNKKFKPSKKTESQGNSGRIPLRPIKEPPKIWGRFKCFLVMTDIWVYFRNFLASCR